MEIMIAAAAVFAGALCAVSLVKSKKEALKKPFDRALIKYGPLPMVKGSKVSFLYGVRNTTPCILIAEKAGIHAAYENSPQADIVIPYGVISDITSDSAGVSADKGEKITVRYSGGEEFVFIYGDTPSDVYFNESALAAGGEFTAEVREGIRKAAQS